MFQHVAKWLTQTLVTGILSANDRFTNTKFKGAELQMLNSLVKVL